MRVNVSVSDPWEIGEAIAWKSRSAELVKLETVGDREAALIKLDEPIAYGGRCWAHLIGVARHSEARLSGLKKGRKVTVSFTGITAQQATSDAPFEELKNWRGGLACIGELEPA